MANATGRREPAETGTSHRFVLSPAKIRLTFLRQDDGSPVPAVAVRLELPDGSTRDLSSDGRGVVETEVPRPGVCVATCALQGARLPTTWAFASVEAGPIDGEDAAGDASQGDAARAVVARVEAHKVSRGESIDSLARANGLTWQELSKFNWGTCVPEEINEHLRDEVGCTRRTADGHNYMFDDSDDPGILFIPTVWRQEGLETGRSHTVRVAAPASPFRLRFVLESETTGHLLPFHPFVVLDAGGAEVARGRTDASAEAAVGVPARGEYEVVPGPAGVHSVGGRLFHADARTPIANASVGVVPWQEPERSVTTGPAGELKLVDVPVGELVLRFGGRECRVYVHGDVADGSFFVPVAPPPGGPYPPEPAYDDHDAMERYRTSEDEPTYGGPDADDGTAVA